MTSCRWMLMGLLCLVPLTALAEPFERLVPSNALGFAHVRLGDASFPTWLAEFLPRFVETSASIQAEIEGRIGFVPERDLSDFGVAVVPRGEGEVMPGVLAVLRWRKPVSQFLPKLPEVVRALTEKPPSLRNGEILGKKVVISDAWIAWFFDPETLCIGTPPLMQKLLTDALPRSDLYQGLQAQVASSHVVLHVDLQRIRASTPGFIEEVAKEPEVARQVLLRGDTLTFRDTENAFDLRVVFSTPEAARLAGVALEVARNQGLMALEQEAQRLNEQSGVPTLRDLFGDYRYRRLMLAVLHDLLKCWTVKVADREVQVLLPFPTQIPGAAIAGVGTAGVLAAIAYPNFRKAREEARMKACFANMRVLLGAVEMYNMDHEQMISSMDEEVIRRLRDQSYLKSDISFPEPECRYYSVGDLTRDGRIVCVVHGSVDGEIPPRRK